MRSAASVRSSFRPTLRETKNGLIKRSRRLGRLAVSPQTIS